MSGGKRKGRHRTFWKMRQKPPKIAQSSALSFGTAFGPLVKEDKYRAVLTKGKEPVETQVEILPSRLNPHSKEDRDLQFKAVMSLYDMMEEMAFQSDLTTRLKRKAWSQG